MSEAVSEAASHDPSPPNRPPLLDPREAWARIDAELPPIDALREPFDVARAEALGRVLARDVAATVDQPPADVSAMDGYACAGAIEPGEGIPVRGVVAAGAPPDFALEPGEVAKIMTGAVVPAGADRVLPVEATDGGTERVALREAPSANAHIRRRGEVVRAGEPMLTAGTTLGPAALSLLAGHGHAMVPVVRPPRVAVLATGDEVVPPDAEPGPGQLRDSNTDFLLAAVRALGLPVESLGIARDDRVDLEAKIARGLEADVLLLCGGVSKGDYDFAEEILEKRGCRRLFDAVAIQPGKPLVAARHAGGWAFGLPGNPASVLVTFYLFVRPTLRRLAGRVDGYWQGHLRARLGGKLPRTKGRDRFFAASIRFENGEPVATPHLPAGSHDTVRYAVGEALVRAPANRDETPAGEPCEILPLVDLGG